MSDDAQWSPPARAGDMLEDAERRAVLRDRALALAHSVEDAQAREALPVMAFRLAGEAYAAETSLIREVYPLTELTPVPCTPSFVSGVISVRGQVLTVLDLRRLLGLPEEGITNMNRLLIVQHDELDLGLLTDEILGMREVPLAALAPALVTAGALGARYVRAVMPDGLILLDLPALLADDRLIVDEEVE